MDTFRRIVENIVFYFIFPPFPLFFLSLNTCGTDIAHLSNPSDNNSIYSKCPYHSKFIVQCVIYLRIKNYFARPNKHVFSKGSLRGAASGPSSTEEAPRWKYCACASTDSEFNLWWASGKTRHRKRYLGAMYYVCWTTKFLCHKMRLLKNW